MLKWGLWNHPSHSNKCNCNCFSGCHGIITTAVLVASSSSSSSSIRQIWKGSQGHTNHHMSDHRTIDVVTIAYVRVVMLVVVKRGSAWWCSLYTLGLFNGKIWFEDISPSFFRMILKEIGYNGWLKSSYNHPIKCLSRVQTMKVDFKIPNMTIVYVELLHSKCTAHHHKMND